MVSRFDLMRQNHKEMPKYLRLTTTLLLLSFIVVPLTLFPHSGFTLHGVSVTYAEYWASGVGFLAVMIGVVFPWCGYLFLIKAPRSRHFFLGILLMWLSIDFLYHLSYVGIDESLFPSKLWWSTSIWVGFTLFMRWYLFSNLSVIEYFSSSGSSKTHDKIRS